jgi:hypothetical protein
VNDTVASARRVAVVCQLDRFANGVKPVQIDRFLRERGHEVHLVDTYGLSRAASSGAALARRLPGRGLRRLALYAVELASVPIRRVTGARRRLSYPLVVADHRLRRSVLQALLPLDEFDLVICETPYDAGVLRVSTAARTLYDCPTPWADELLYEGRLTARQHARLRQYEAELFESVDRLAFHWPSYARYAVEHYGISGRNLMRLDWGCTPRARRAEFATPPRIAYIGSLSSRFIDRPLLRRLSHLYPQIDVFGAPPPPPSLGLNYRGYASTDVLERYQLGLITCTKDELRASGFSAKHLEYLSHGLPVLAPAWRRHLDLLPGTVRYDEGSFTSVIERLSDETEWRRLSDAAYAGAQHQTWDKTLRPLENVLRGDAPPRPALVT